MAKHKIELPSLTSINDADAQDWLKTAKERQTLTCTRIPGFHLVRLKTGGIWRWRYTDALGKRRVATVGKSANLNADDAAKVVAGWIQADIDPLRDKVQRQDQKRQAISDSERRTLRYYLEHDYRRVMESWSYESAVTNYQRILKHFPEWLDRDMATITRPDVRAWQDKIEAQGRVHTTIQRTFGAVKTLLNQAVADGVLDVNPLDKVKLRPPTKAVQNADPDEVRKGERRMLTNDEQAALYHGLRLFDADIKRKNANSRTHGKGDTLDDLSQRRFPHWFTPFCLLALHTGLRTGDLFTLTWKELNVEFGRLVKTPAKTAHKAARAGKQPAVVDMGLNETILDVMRTWKAEQGDGDLVFPSPRTGRQMTKGAHNKPWEAVKKLGGLPETLVFYAMRHHFISSLIEQGEGYDLIKALAGHKSIAMIEQHYGHLSAERKSRPIDVTAGRPQPKFGSVDSK